VSAGDGEPGLVRQIGTGGLALTVVNMIVGVGIFGLPGLVAAALGPAAILAYIGCAGLAALIALCLAEAVSRVPEAGGVMGAAGAAFGPVGRSVVGNLLWFAGGVLASSAIAVLLVNTLSVVWPGLAGGPLRVTVLAALYLTLATLNIRGVRQGLGATAVVSVFKFTPLVLLVVVGLWHVEPSNLTFTRLPGITDYSAAVMLLFFAFQGGEAALCTSGEVVRPERTIARGLALGLVLVGLLYLGLQTVGQGVLGDELARSTDAPLVATAQAVFGQAGVSLILFTTAMSVLGILMVDVLSMPRALFALGHARLLPAVLGRVHARFRTPFVAIATYCSAAFLLAATGTFRQLVIFAAGGVLLMHLVTAAAVLRLRRDPRYAERPGFRIPGGALVPLLTVAVIVSLVGTLRGSELAALAALCVAAAIPGLAARRAG
jgi:APA family basic amino acid/polyamine antiporter